MAAFNPQTQDVGIPNSTGVSRGPGVNRTFETLFSGLTQTAENVAKVKDTATQLDIQDDATDVFNQVNQEFGVDTPDGMTDGLDNMQTLQNAFEQGKLSEVNYYGRLATLSKQLRSRYPGYEHIVDSTIQSVTGTRPANAYRDAILQQIGKAQSEAGDTARFQRQYLKENEGIIASIFPDYAENPGKYSFDQLQVGVSRYKSKEESINMRTKELQLMSSENQFNDVQAKKTIDQDFSFITQSFLSSAVNANDPSFETRINDFTARGGGTPQETDQFISLISQAETTLRQRLYQRGQSQYVAHGILSNDDLNKAIDDAMYPLRQAKTAILGGDFKLASRYATLNKVVEDKQMNDLFSDPDIRMGSGLTKINTDLGREWFAKQQDDIFGRVTDSRSKQIGDEIVGRVMNGQTDILSKTVDQGDSGLTKSALNSSFNVLIDQNVGPDNVHNVVQSIFGPQAKNWMDRRVVSPEDMESLYTKFLDPRVTQSIYSKGSKEDQDTYFQWAMTSARSIPAFSAAAGDINSLNANLKDWKSQLQLQFDPKTMRVQVVADQGLNPREVATVWKPYGRSVDAINKVFSVLGPIIDARGGDREEVAREFVRSLSVDLDGVNPTATGAGAESKKGFFAWMYDGLTQPLGEAIAEAKGPNSSGSPDDRDQGGTILPEISEDGGELDFMSSDMDEEETGGLLDPVGSKMSDEARSQTRTNLGLEFVEPRSNTQSMAAGVLDRFANRRLPAAIRLNNPGAISIVGNIDNSFAAKQPGFTGVVKRPKNEGGYYAQFATPQHGIAAASKLLQRYGRQGTNTPVEITRKWAAAPGNYPNVLVRFLRQAGYDVSKNTPLNLNDPNVRMAILKAKSAHESGVGRPVYNDNVYQEGVSM